MFWPLVLPFQITFIVLFVAVIVLSVYAPPKYWKRFSRFAFYATCSFVAFIPSCTGIMLVIDAYRFGDFSYASYDEIPDFRSRRYMPKAAANISMQKFPNGYYARYEIPLKEFDGYLDDLWERYAERSGSQRGDDIDEGEIAGPEEIVATFGELGWECPTSAIIYHSPTEMDGGGATYYVDRDSAIVLQQTGFW